ncbi:hypothetical protein [Streptomyces sp. AP-93]|uniref:hypothetical protein n=1 Tax=Streptomyces sp. AP-93 TaxID=2929048 RepID=UPI001FAF600C|nr:hypothetical protein [Streptomyces sp. AP-93]MCJ0875227.1 hypothetical protein [Streptomyces sp. AP-93]
MSTTNIPPVPAEPPTVHLEQEQPEHQEQQEETAPGRATVFMDNITTAITASSPEKKRRKKTPKKVAALQADRVRRFRRWVLLTGVSGYLGWCAHLPQAAASLDAPLPVQVFGLFMAWGLDLRMRGWGAVTVSQVRGPFALALVVVTRMPFASLLLVTGQLIPAHS